MLFYRGDFFYTGRDCQKKAAQNCAAEVREINVQKQEDK